MGESAASLPLSCLVCINFMFAILVRIGRSCFFAIFSLVFVSTQKTLICEIASSMNALQPTQAHARNTLSLSFPIYSSFVCSCVLLFGQFGHSAIFRVDCFHFYFYGATWNVAICYFDDTRVLTKTISKLYFETHHRTFIFNFETYWPHV